MLVRKNRGIKLGRRLIRVFKWVTRSRFRSSRYRKLDSKAGASRKSRAISKLCKWGKSIRHGLFKSGNRGYNRVDHDPEFDQKSVQVPKGHLAVYVGERDGEIQRVLVPVLFLNHPLFEKLLKESEKVYGFNQPGQITIPCPISEFEHVQTKIAAGEKFRHRLYRRSHIPGIKCL
uniref:Uncharacterized protein n=1 Tax=Opuntia streptacantha TaxID=393608 RepID=A0A7C8YE36_OPUST